MGFLTCVFTSRTIHLFQQGMSKTCLTWMGTFTKPWFVCMARGELATQMSLVSPSGFIPPFLSQVAFGFLATVAFWLAYLGFCNIIDLIVQTLLDEN